MMALAGPLTATTTSASGLRVVVVVLALLVSTPSGLRLVTRTAGAMLGRLAGAGKLMLVTWLVPPGSVASTGRVRMPEVTSYVEPSAKPITVPPSVPSTPPRRRLLAERPAGSAITWATRVAAAVVVLLVVVTW